MAAFPPQDKRSQIMLLLIVVALVVGYLGYAGFATVGLTGFKPLGLQRDSMQKRIDTLTAQVAAIKKEVASGDIAKLDQRLAEFASTLAQVRLLVPLRSEVPNLLDDISSRAKMRGTIFAGFTPQTTESGTPFDTQRYRVAAAGQYDQIAEFLTDIASLPRIIVPYDLHLAVVQGPLSDSTRTISLLQAAFVIKTFVKEIPDTTAAARPAAPARGGDE